MTWATVNVCYFIFLIGIISAAKQSKLQDASTNYYQHQVSLRLFGKHFCGGSIISPRHILTAAHCVAYVNEYLLSIHSVTDMPDIRGKLHWAQSIHIHPEWENDRAKGYPNDIAVIALMHSISWEYGRPIPLPKHEVQDFQKAYLTGWGSATNWDHRPSKILKDLRVEVLTSEKCKPQITHKITKYQLCSIAISGTGICNGDGGGPLVANGELVGIVSFMNTETCATGTPNIYTNVFAYKDFIEFAMNEEEL